MHIYYRPPYAYNPFPVAAGAVPAPLPAAAVSPAPLPQMPLWLGGGPFRKYYATSNKSGGGSQVPISKTEQRDMDVEGKKK
jgi:hypothetical protein